jgi:hypothetical protein
MKIKTDFVTNSSSCCYVFCVPKDFNLKEFLSKDLDMDYEEDQKLSESIDSFISSGYCYEIDDREAFDKISSLMVEFRIASFDTDSDRGLIKLLTVEEITEQTKIIMKAKGYENKE